MYTDWMTILLGCGLLALAVVLLRAYRQIHVLRTALETQQENVRHIESDFRAICEGVRHMGDDFMGIDKRIRRLSERQDSLDMREPDLATYKQAISLVQKGADVDQLVDTCGLGRSEAELVYLMHHQATPINSAGGRSLN